MLQPISDALNLLLQPCYDLSGNWWVAILLFTLATKVILMPVSLWSHRSGLTMLQLMPELNRIKAKHFGDKETIGEMQAAMYKQKGYHPLVSLVPLLIQILILFGLVDVVHAIAESGAPGTENLGLTPLVDGGLTWLWPVAAVCSALCLCYAQNRINPLQREQSSREQLMTNGLSVGLALVLGILVPAGLAFYWVCSNLSSILVQVACNLIMKPEKYVDYDDLAESRIEIDELNAIGKEDAPKRKFWQRDPLAKREKADYKRFFNIADKHLVFYSEGSGFYKYFEGVIEYILTHSSGVIHYVTNDPNDQVFELAKTMPRLVPYYIGQQRAITLMMKMDADVVVMTLQDLDTYYIKRSYVRKDIEYIFLFHHMTSTHLVSAKTALFNYDTILMTGPHQEAEIRKAEELYDLPEKRLVEAGYDLIDRAIVNYGKLQEEEAERAQERAEKAASEEKAQAEPEEAKDEEASSIVDEKAGEDAKPEAEGSDAEEAEAEEGKAAEDEGEAGKDAEGDSRKEAAATPDFDDGKPTVLIAPSWQVDSILDTCIDDLVKGLLGHGWHIIVRPHPEYTKRYRARWEGLQARWEDTPADELYFERDFSSNRTVWTSAVLITDWSSIAGEFSFSTLKPSIFIDTPMKVHNPDWEELGIEPTDISMRNQIGVSVAMDDVESIGDVVQKMMDEGDEWTDRIREVREGFLFNIGHAAEVSGEYILQAVLRAQEAHAQAKEEEAAKEAEDASEEAKEEQGSKAKEGKHGKAGASEEEPEETDAEDGEAGDADAAADGDEPEAATDEDSTDDDALEDGDAQEPEGDEAEDLADDGVDEPKSGASAKVKRGAHVKDGGRAKKRGAHAK